MIAAMTARPAPLSSVARLPLPFCWLETPLARLAAVVLLGASGSPALAQQAPATPSAQKSTDPRSIEIPGPIRAEPANVNFGIVEPGSTVSATIKLFNPLDRDVRISAAKPSCTCTTIDMVGKTIPAGGSIDMPMSMKTAHTPGSKVAAVNMAFEGVTQVLVVKIEAETAYAVRATPNFIDALAAERMTGTFELSSSDGVPFTVKSVDGRPAMLADGTPMKPATRHTLRYDVTQPSPLSNPYLAVPPFLIIETDHPKCPILDMRVRHATTRITPAFGFAEFRANCGVMASKGSAEFEIEIKHLGAARIASVDSLLPAAKTELLSQTADGSSALVKVRVTDLGMKPGPFLFPCRFTGDNKVSDFWLFGTVR